MKQPTWDRFLFWGFQLLLEGIDISYLLCEMISILGIVYTIDLPLVTMPFQAVEICTDFECHIQNYIMSIMQMIEMIDQ